MTRDDIKQLHVALLAGGWSDEAGISMDSGRNCLSALQEAGFTHVDLLNVADPDFVTTMVNGKYDVAFIAMHGRYGEDGCIQGLLEIMHIPYTFSGVLASALGTNKDAAKEIYRAAGIPVPEGTTVDGSCADDPAKLHELVEKYGLPLFVKPSANGSSYGISRVAEEAALPEAIRKAASEGDAVLVENCIEGKEITVPVIGNADDELQALPIVEIVFDSEYYDVKVKYEPASMHHVIPARLTDEETKRAQEYAMRAHRALGCKGASRCDFIVKDDGTPVLLEINTIPGMTERSLLPDSARAAGISFPELCTRFVEWALQGR